MAIKKTELENITQRINKAQSILVCVNNRASFDAHASAVALILFLRDLEKNVQVGVNGSFGAKSQKLFDENSIDFVETIGPKKYVVTLDHRDCDIDKVSYDDKDGKFYLYITPTPESKDFDFSRVEFSDSGKSVDLVIVVGARKLEWFGELYSENKAVFNGADLISINNIEGDQEVGDCILTDPEISTSELVYSVVKNGGSTVSVDKIIEVLLLGIVDYLQLLNISSFRVSTLEMLTSLVKNGGDLKDAVQCIYCKRDLKSFIVTQRASRNVKFDENMGVVWSIVDKSEFSELDIDGKGFDLGSKLLFNCCESFKVAFAMYEVGVDEVLVELESNRSDIDAEDIIKSYKVSGNSSRIIFKISNKRLEEVEESILRDIGEYLVELNSEPYSSRHEGLKDLTNGVNSVDNTEDVEELEDASGFVSPPPISPSE